MLWHSTVSATGFSSTIGRDDVSSSGKWLVPIELGDPETVWGAIGAAVLREEFVAAKHSARHLDAKLGHHLVCVYCADSSRETVERALAGLRSIGISGPLNYKSDRATERGRDEHLWSSDDFEPPALAASR